MNPVRYIRRSLLRTLSWYRAKLFGRTPVFDARKDPVFQDVIKRQNRVIEAYQDKFGEDRARLFQQLLQESWASPEDYREQT